MRLSLYVTFFFLLFGSYMEPKYLHFPQTQTLLDQIQEMAEHCRNLNTRCIQLLHLIELPTEDSWKMKRYFRPSSDFFFEKKLPLRIILGGGWTGI